MAPYQVPGKPGAAVRGKLQPFLAAKSVPCLDEAAPVTNVASAADEIAKLASLHDSGAMSDEEFTAHKAKLLEQRRTYRGSRAPTFPTLRRQSPAPIRWARAARAASAMAWSAHASNPWPGRRSLKPLAWFASTRGMRVLR